jgi:hypothetical protein
VWFIKLKILSDFLQEGFAKLWLKNENMAIDLSALCPQGQGSDQKAGGSEVSDLGAVVTVSSAVAAEWFLIGHCCLCLNGG